MTYRFNHCITLFCRDIWPSFSEHTALVLLKSQRHLSHNQTKTSPMLIIILIHMSPFSEAGSPYIAHFGLELMSLLPQLSECWVSFPTVLIQVTNSFRLTGERRVPHIPCGQCPICVGAEISRDRDRPQVDALIPHDSRFSSHSTQRGSVIELMRTFQSAELLRIRWVGAAK